MQLGTHKHVAHVQCINILILPKFADSFMDLPTRHVPSTEDLTKKCISIFIYLPQLLTGK